MKKSTISVKKKKAKGQLVELYRIFTGKQTWICFGLMAVLYLFSMFGGMFSTTTFTYADF